MTQRINPYEKSFRTIRPLLGIGGYLAKSPVEQSLFDLVYLRVSQINGCAYCIDMHAKDLLANGESEQRLFVLNAWREADLYTDKERAALAWAEAVNELGAHGVPDAIFEEAKQYFSDEELIDLTVAVIGVSSFNRLNVAFQIEGGSYQPGQHTAAVAVG
jgi:AhpD family alkylhydroperoxidase